MKKINILWLSAYLFSCNLVAITPQETLSTVDPVICAVLNQAAKLTLDNEKEDVNEWTAAYKETFKDAKPIITASGVELDFNQLVAMHGNSFKDIRNETDIELFWYFGDAPPAIKQYMQSQIDEKVKDHAVKLAEQEKSLSSWLGYLYYKLPLVKKLPKSPIHKVRFHSKKAMPIDGEAVYLNDHNDLGDNLNSYIRCTLTLKADNFHLPPSVFTEVLEAHIKAKAALQSTKSVEK